MAQLCVLQVASTFKWNKIIIHMIKIFKIKVIKCIKTNYRFLEFPILINGTRHFLTTYKNFTEWNIWVWLAHGMQENALILFNIGIFAL